MARLEEEGRVESVLGVEEASVRVESVAGDDKVWRVGSAERFRGEVVGQQFVHQVEPTEEALPHKQPPFDDE